jgi:hypothetical protein
LGGNRHIRHDQRNAGENKYYFCPKFIHKFFKNAQKKSTASPNGFPGNAPATAHYQ